MNRLARHEDFQRQVARGAALDGAVVLSTSTTAPCDLVILAPHRFLLLVEIKTVGRGHSGGALKPLQKALMRRCRGFGYPDPIFVHLTKKNGPQPTYSIKCEPEPNLGIYDIIREWIRLGERNA